MLHFYGGALLAPYPPHKLEDHALSNSQLCYF